MPPAGEVRFLDVIRRPELLLARANQPCLVRLDLGAHSDEEVPRALLERGFDDAQRLGGDCISPAALAALPPARGRILHPRQKHLGFLRVLDELQAVFAARDRWILLNPVDDVKALFDKRVTSRRYAALGIAVPEPLDVDGVRDGAGLVARMDEAGLDALFVKLAAGSTGECMALVRVGRRGPELLTTIERAADGWYNTRRLQRVRDARGFDEVVAWLLGEGSQVERAVDKAHLDGRWFDCRKVVVDGAVLLTVVRQSRLPITNLHLGGQRGDLDAFDRLVPAALREAADESCRRVFAAHRSLQLGIDVLFEAGSLRPMVIEANAFGDHLVKEGLRIYRAQIRAAQRRYA